MKHSESLKELALALTKAQAAMTGAKKDSNNPFYKTKYADLSSVVDAIKPHLTANGLSYVQFPCTNDKDEVGVETMLIHASGEWLRGDPFYVPVNKQDAQGFGSAITYCRRYSLQSACGIAPEDDDGNAAAAAKPMSGSDAVIQRIKDAKVDAAQETKDAFHALPQEAQQIVREWAMEIIGIMADGSKSSVERIDLAARYVMEKTKDGSDQEGLLALSSQLEAKVRNPIKNRMMEIRRINGVKQVPHPAEQA
jgi:hypothetical protein